MKKHIGIDTAALCPGLVPVLMFKTGIIRLVVGIECANDADGGAARTKKYLVLFGLELGARVLPATPHLNGKRVFVGFFEGVGKPAYKALDFF